MTIAGPEAPTDALSEPVRLHPLLMIRITAEGVVMPRLDVEPRLMIDVGDWRSSPDRVVPLGRAHLEVLAALGADPDLTPRAALDHVIARRGLAGPSADELVTFVRELVDQRLLTPGHRSTGRLRAPRPGSTPPPPADAAEPDAGEWTANVSVALPLGTDGRFEVSDHDGWVVDSLDPVEVLIATAFRRGATAASAHDELIATGAFSADELTAEDVALAARRLASVGVLRPGTPGDPDAFRAAVVERLKLYADGDRLVVESFERAREHFQRTGIRQPVVVGLDIDFIPMLSLGMVMAYARAFDGGALEDRFEFAPLWHTTVERLQTVLDGLEPWPAVFLFSHYVWNTEANLGFSAAVKQRFPEALTIHGGPSVPKYDEDAKAFLSAHPHVDVTVRGEGEATLAHTLAALGESWPATTLAPALPSLRTVEGITYRDGDQVVRTPDRDRIEDLDTIPSPYLTGMFDHIDRFHVPAMVLETNRGCPYGCTFCDWGSATLSRVRKFDIERVLAEMEWSAQRGIEAIYTADANYGLLDRDVDIVRYAVELKQQYGVPKVFNTTFAKNRVKNLAEIVRIVAEGGIEMLSVASVQSFDAEVLEAVHRSNIKQERYDALIGEFRHNGFPLYTDIMLGLPGSTVETTKSDFQAALDRELHVKANPTELLVNSPMNAPSYREEHGIVARPGEYVSQTTSFSRSDWEEMMGLRRMLNFAERYGLLRQIATYVRAETGMREVDFYDLVRRAGADHRRWPFLSYCVTIAPDEFIPPGSWWPVIEEIGAFAVAETGVADDSALLTVLTVQHAVFPARDRSFPFEVDLDHDYPAWHARVLDAKLAEGDAWPAAVEPLRTTGPIRFVVRDDDDVCGRVTGLDTHGTHGELVWELDSAVMRPKHRTLGDLRR